MPNQITIALIDLVIAARLPKDEPTPADISLEIGLYRALLVAGATVASDFHPEQDQVFLGWMHVPGLSKRAEDEMPMSCDLAPGRAGPHYLPPGRAQLVIDEAAEQRLCKLVAQALRLAVAEDDRWCLTSFHNGGWSLYCAASVVDNAQMYIWGPSGIAEAGVGIRQRLTVDVGALPRGREHWREVLVKLLLATARQIAEIGAESLSPAKEST